MVGENRPSCIASPVKGSMRRPKPRVVRRLPGYDVGRSFFFTRFDSCARRQRAALRFSSGATAEAASRDSGNRRFCAADVGRRATRRAPGEADSCAGNPDSDDSASPRASRRVSGPAYRPASKTWRMRSRHEVAPALGFCFLEASTTAAHRIRNQQRTQVTKRGSGPHRTRGPSPPDRRCTSDRLTDLALRADPRSG